MEISLNTVIKLILVIIGVVLGSTETLSWTIVLGALLVLFVLTDIVITLIYKESKDTTYESETTDEAYFFYGYSNGISRVVRGTYDVNNPKNISYDVNYVDETGNYITRTWYSAGTDFNEDGLAIVSTNGKFNVIKKDGTYLYPDKWFDRMFEFTDKKAKVYNDRGEVNFLTVDGELSWKTWREENLSENGEV